MGTWTHPSHRYTATMGFILSLTALVLVLAAMVDNWYCDHRSKPDDKCSSILEDDVLCNKTMCRFKSTSSDEDEEADWQKMLFPLLVTATSLDAVNVVSQLFVFWPCVLCSRVFGRILSACIFFHVLSGAFKFVVSLIIMTVSTDINHTYAWFGRDALGMKLRPLAFVQFSLIMSFLAMAMLRLTNDVGAPGKPTYLEEMKADKQAEAAAKQIAERVSIYKPRQMPASAYVVRTEDKGHTAL